jgi:hypothetical protein
MSVLLPGGQDAVAHGDTMREAEPMKITKSLVWFVSLLMLSSLCFAQKKKQVQNTVQGEFCQAPTLPAPGAYKPDDAKGQPNNTADLPTVVATVEQALKCYQESTKGSDPTQPNGLPKLSSAVFDFKTTTAKTAGFSISFFIFKVGASSEKDVTDDVSFTYSVPKTVPPKAAGFVKPPPPDLFSELVKDVQAAAHAAQAQSTALGMPLSQVKIQVAFGIKIDANASLNLPVHLITIGGNGDYNKNNIQTITLTFGAGTGAGGN